MPTGTTLTTTQAAGTVLGVAKAQVSALLLGGALLPLEGNIVVAAAGQVPAATQAACTQGQTPTATWILVLQAAGQTINLPAFLLPTAGAETALGPAKLVFCLPPPDVPVAQGGATFGAKFLQADLKVNGVFSAVAAGAWLGIWTPYVAGGQVNAAGTVASPSAVAPGEVTLKVTKSGLVNSRLTGLLTQGGQPTGGHGADLLRLEVHEPQARRHAEGRREGDVLVPRTRRRLGSSGCAGPRPPRARRRHCARR